MHRDIYFNRGYRPSFLPKFFRSCANFRPLYRALSLSFSGSPLSLNCQSVAGLTARYVGGARPPSGSPGKSSPSRDLRRGVFFGRVASISISCNLGGLRRRHDRERLRHGWFGEHVLRICSDQDAGEISQNRLLATFFYSVLSSDVRQREQIWLGINIFCLLLFATAFFTRAAQVRKKVGKSKDPPRIGLFLFSHSTLTRIWGGIF